ncbi:hypothetical protein [Tenacibaculum piscium]|uniref:hypothetical protein n=1 Tax=Tenacibaculum piscium TaxID=1458515 RepID=UPI001F47FECF|nr:hypothetical protein [Tenacibaculum piscium]
MINTHFATGTAPINQNIHWQTLALLLEQLQKSKHRLINTHFATGTAPVNQNIHWQILTLLLEQLQ